MCLRHNEFNVWSIFHPWMLVQETVMTSGGHGPCFNNQTTPMKVLKINTRVTLRSPFRFLQPFPFTTKLLILTRAVFHLLSHTILLWPKLPFLGLRVYIKHVSSWWNDIFCAFPPHLCVYLLSIFIWIKWYFMYSFSGKKADVGFLLFFYWVCSVWGLSASWLLT